MVQILAQPHFFFWGDMDMFFFMSRRVVSPFVLSSSESTVLICFNNRNPSSQVFQEWLQTELHALEERLRAGLVDDLRPLLRQPFMPAA